MPHHRPLPSREELLEHLRYDPKTGLLWWIKAGPARRVSAPAGHKVYNRSTSEPVSIEIRVNKRLWKAHRLAWVIITGLDPGRLTIDHINRNPFDNRWANLRLADQSMQTRNQRARGASGHKGVWFNPEKRKWRATAWVDGKAKFIGYFDHKQEAAKAAAPYFIA